MTMLNATFEQKLALDNEGYESSWKITMYPLHLEEHRRFTWFPALRTSLSTQFQLHQAVPDNLTSGLYTGG